MDRGRYQAQRYVSAIVAYRRAAKLSRESDGPSRPAGRHGIERQPDHRAAEIEQESWINTASAARLLTIPVAAAYVASKHAVVGLSETLYRELEAPKSAFRMRLLKKASALPRSSRSSIATLKATIGMSAANR